jgi:hypothetical protein
MQQDDFPSALQESEDLLWAAQPNQLQPGIRILACQVAYARRHHECPPIDEVNRGSKRAGKIRPEEKVSPMVWPRSSRF